MSTVLMSIRINTRSMDKINRDTEENSLGGWELGRVKRGGHCRTETRHKVGFAG